MLNSLRPSDAYIRHESKLLREILKIMITGKFSQYFCSKGENSVKFIPTSGFSISPKIRKSGKILKTLMPDICISKLTITGSDNGLSPGRRQAIIWTNAGILLIGPLGTNFSQVLIEIHKFSFKKMRLKVSSVKWRPCCLGLNVLTSIDLWACITNNTNKNYGMYSDFHVITLMVV